MLVPLVAETIELGSMKMRDLAKSKPRLGARKNGVVC